MIDFAKAEKAFKEYLKDYDLNDDKIKHKINHTNRVVELSEYISKDLNLDQENINLAKLIALLHDIGRFEQATLYQDYRDYATMDHADYGVEILFHHNLIREFIEDSDYDNIIMKAVKNHNKYQIEEGLSEEELLHTKIIRDADKTDSFYSKSVFSVKTMANIDEEIMIKELITDEIFNDFMSHKTIVSSKRKTFVDMWVSYIAFIFDYNFASGLKYIKEKDYINVLVDRFKFWNEDTKIKMEQIRECANNYVNDKINEL